MGVLGLQGLGLGALGGYRIQGSSLEVGRFRCFRQKGFGVVATFGVLSG